MNLHRPKSPKRTNGSQELQRFPSLNRTARDTLAMAGREPLFKPRLQILLPSSAEPSLTSKHSTVLFECWRGMPAEDGTAHPEVAQKLKHCKQGVRVGYVAVKSTSRLPEGSDA